MLTSFAVRAPRFRTDSTLRFGVGDCGFVLSGYVIWVMSHGDLNLKGRSKQSEVDLGSVRRLKC
jgi:hypothetical protein